MREVLLTISFKIKGNQFPTKVYRETSMADALKIRDIFDELSNEMPESDIDITIIELT